jgi:hypothetical protein
MTYPDPSYGNYLIFPPIVAGVQGASVDSGRSWNTNHVGTENLDVFNARRDKSYWRISLGGITLHPSQINEWDDFVDAAEGMANPVLFRLNSKRFSITKELIGTGDGSKSTFQLQRSGSYQGSTPKIRTIKFPWHNYPPQTLPNGVTVLATEYVKIYVGADPDTATEMLWQDGWDLDRETGIITFDAAPAAGANIYATCKFLIKVHMQDWMPVSSQGGGAYTFSNSAEVFEPKGQ